MAHKLTAEDKLYAEKLLRFDSEGNTSWLNVGSIEDLGISEFVDRIPSAFLTTVPLCDADGKNGRRVPYLAVPFETDR